MIPRHIHQTWHSRELPANLQRYHQSWRRHHPAWQILLYDDSACTQFVRQHYPALLEIYEGYRLSIQRADLFRYLVVYHYGGLYADVDMECLRPLDRFLEMGSIVLSVEAHLTQRRRQELAYPQPLQVANCIFAAQPRHWFLERVIEEAVHRASWPVSSDADIEETTGPRLLTRVYYDLAPAERSQIVLLPQVYWMPPTSYPNCWPFNRHIYARHYFLGSWKQTRKPVSTFSRRWIERSRLPNPWPRTFQEVL